MTEKITELIYRTLSLHDGKTLCCGPTDSIPIEIQPVVTLLKKTLEGGIIKLLSLPFFPHLSVEKEWPELFNYHQGKLPGTFAL